MELFFLLFFFSFYVFFILFYSFTIGRKKEFMMADEELVIKNFTPTQLIKHYIKLLRSSVNGTEKSYQLLACKYVRGNHI